MNIFMHFTLLAPGEIVNQGQAQRLALPGGLNILDRRGKSL